MKNPFKSFWWGGFECADHLNAFGHRVDFLTSTGHLARLHDDYEQLPALGIGVVREGIRWSQVEQEPGCYDWSSVTRLIIAGATQGVQQVWDLCHFGYPDDLTPLHPLFVQRFVALCRAFVRYYRTLMPTTPLLVTPIVEVSFISWLGGEANGTVPYAHGQGWRVKYLLLKAYIEAIRVMKQEDSNLFIVATEPLTYTAPARPGTREQIEQALHQDEYQWQAMDMLTGRMCPELGGAPDLVDILGVNYYWMSQVECGGPALSWVPDDCRRVDFASLLIRAYERYQLPLVIAETGHFGDPAGRARWIREAGEACVDALAHDVPLWGCCLYPVLDRTDWDHLERPCHRPGLLDAADPSRADSERVVCEAAVVAWREIQERVAQQEVVNQ